MSRGQTPNAKGEIVHTSNFPRNTSPKPCSSFLRSHTQPKSRRNLRSRYANMMESIRSRTGRSVSSDSGSISTRRTRSSSITSPLLLTTPYQDSDHGRLGTEFSILKFGAPKSQTQQVALPRILALPPWLQDTITELGPSHPLGAVFPALHDSGVPEPGIATHSPKVSPDYPVLQRAHPNDANWSFRFPSTLPRTPLPRLHQPDSDTSSNEPRPPSIHYPLYPNNSLLHLRSGSPASPVGGLTRPDVFPTPTTYPSPTAPTKAANTAHISAHISGLKTAPPSASSSNRDPTEPISSTPRRKAEYDGVFTYAPSYADSAAALSPPQPFFFERPVQAYFDSPTEDPVSSDPFELDDYDPFKLDPEECKNLSFKWAPFYCEPGSADVTSTSAPSSDENTGEVRLVSDGSDHDLAHPYRCC